MIERRRIGAMVRNTFSEDSFVSPFLDKTQLETRREMVSVLTRHTRNLVWPHNAVRHDVRGDGEHVPREVTLHVSHAEHGVALERVGREVGDQQV